MTAATERVRVLLAEDDAAVREALAALIGTEAGLELVAQAGDAGEAVELAVRHRPDVALLDVRMPGGGGPRATRAIRQACPRTQVLALSAYGEREYVLEMIRAGAVGFLVKGLPGEELLLAIHRSARGETSLSASIAASVLDELAERLEMQHRDDTNRQAQLERVRKVLLGESMLMVFQPIADLALGTIVGFEALARFDDARGPDLWFAEAQAVGLGTQLELAAVRTAVRHLPQLPSRSYLAVNVSPATAMSTHLLDALGEVDLSRIVIEITEHAPVADYDALAAATQSLRARGVRLAVDDAGSGFASLRHILRLSPDVIKLDRTLTADVDTDAAREALAAALTLFASRIGSTVVAEGIEREEELLTLRDLGVLYGQGYYLARPAALSIDPAEVPRTVSVPPAASPD